MLPMFRSYVTYACVFIMFLVPYHSHYFMQKAYLALQGHARTADEQAEYEMLRALFE